MVMSFDDEAEQDVAAGIEQVCDEVPPAFAELDVPR